MQKSLKINHSTYHISLLIMVCFLTNCTEPDKETLELQSDMNIAQDMSLSDEDQTTNPDPQDMQIEDMDLVVDQTVLTDQEVDLADQEMSTDYLVNDATIEMTDIGLPTSDMNVPLEPISCGLEFQMRAPASLSFHPLTTPPIVQGTLLNQEMEVVNNATVTLYDQLGNLLTTAVTDMNGEFSFEGVSVNTYSGQKELLLKVSVQEQPCLEEMVITYYLCHQQYEDDFSILGPNWSLFRDAVWDERGWLEMTGIENNRGGAVYNAAEAIQSGVASIEFTLITGGGVNGGADGFAFTIVELMDPTTFIDLLTAANAGGGLGYGVSGNHADPDYTLEGEALTVEIDTFYNNSNSRHLDPTSANHIAITRNGDPGDHIAWFAVNDIEDLMPHTVKVDLLGDSMRIYYDGELAIEQDISFIFKGGYMFFSGSTGWATNYHRFDDLKVLHECQ